MDPYEGGPTAERALEGWNERQALPGCWDLTGVEGDPLESEGRRWLLEGIQRCR